MNDYIITIPARYHSSRLEGKPLMDINGKEMLLRVWEKCFKACKNKMKIIVLTDDYRIINFCKNKNINVHRTSKKCLTGTDRIYEFALKNKFQIYINVQGDEPFVNSNDIKKIIITGLLNKTVTNYMTKAKKNEYLNNSIPKVVYNMKNELLFMSRSAIPADKNVIFKHKIFKQVCIYSYPYNDLISFGNHRKKTPIEKIEDIEILRFLELGIKVKMLLTNHYSISVDTLSDLKKANIYSRVSN
jgi:3-deoxy-manno-octulosonate cytidylyltransferase (CMP-KDO synthetase)